MNDIKIEHLKSLSLELFKTINKVNAVCNVAKGDMLIFSDIETIGFLTTNFSDMSITLYPDIDILPDYILVHFLPYIKKNKLRFGVTSNRKFYISITL